MLLPYLEAFGRLLGGINKVLSELIAEVRRSEICFSFKEAMLFKIVHYGTTLNTSMSV